MKPLHLRQHQRFSSSAKCTIAIFVSMLLLASCDSQRLTSVSAPTEPTSVPSTTAVAAPSAAATTSSTAPPTSSAAPIDWADRSYPNLCGSSIDLTDGVGKDDYQTVTLLDQPVVVGGYLLLSVTCDYGAASSIGAGFAIMNSNGTQTSWVDLPELAERKAVGTDTVSYTGYEWTDNDPHCCPSLEYTTTYTITSDGNATSTRSPVTPIDRGPAVGPDLGCVSSPLGIGEQRPAEIAALQTTLYAAGLLGPSDVDGSFGPDTASAITEWARTQSMPGEEFSAATAYWSTRGVITLPYLTALGVACSGYQGIVVDGVTL